MAGKSLNSSLVLEPPWVGRGVASTRWWEMEGLKKRNGNADPTSSSSLLPLSPPSFSSSSSSSPSPTAEKVSSLGKDWHKFCLKCERCNKTLTPGGHAEHDGKPFCHKPCYATLFGPKGVNIGGAGSYIYEKPLTEGPQVTGPIEVPVARTEEQRKASGPPKGPSKASSVTTFTGEPNMCPRCNKRVYFAEKVTSLGKDWHRPCLRCERCSKTLTPGGHAEHDGQPYCHKPCYGILFGPKGVNTGAVGSYIYDKDPEGTVQP